MNDFKPFPDTYCVKNNCIYFRWYKKEDRVQCCKPHNIECLAKQAKEDEKERNEER